MGTKLFLNGVNFQKPIIDTVVTEYLKMTIGTAPGDPTRNRCYADITHDDCYKIELLTTGWEYIIMTNPPLYDTVVRTWGNGNYTGDLRDCRIVCKKAPTASSITEEELENLQIEITYLL